jgi:hypothetical protein
MNPVAAVTIGTFLHFVPQLAEQIRSRIHATGALSSRQLSS